MATTVNIGKRNRTSLSNSQHWKFPISDLPKDILINILCCLPTKTIVRCKQVCKEWLNIILDPRFAETHYNYITTTSRLSLVSYPYAFNSAQDDSIYLIENYNNPYDDYELVSSKFIHNVPSLINQKFLYVVNSCQGFLFLTTFILMLPIIINDFHVYNPLTKQHFKVPPLIINNKLGDIHPTMLGLGFGLVTKQYKVVRVVVDKDKGVYDLEVLTLGTDHVWRSVQTNKISSYLHDKVFLTHGGPLALNGVLHWSMDIFKKHKYTDQVTKLGEKIACFDVDKEELSAMTSPCSKDSNKFIVTIGNVNGMLCLGIMKRGKPGETELWIMREYGVKESWGVYVVLKDDIISGFPSLVAVCDNGKIGILEDNYSHFYLFTYHQKDGKSTRLRISGFDETMQATAANYVPSFFSIDDKGH